jgi:hypothetical protein
LICLISVLCLYLLPSVWCRTGTITCCLPPATYCELGLSLVYITLERIIMTIIIIIIIITIIIIIVITMQSYATE